MVSPVLAQVAPAAPPAAMTTPASWLSVADLTAILSATGLTVLSVDVDDGRYEVCVVGANGVAFEADVDPLTGILLPGIDDSCGGAGDDRRGRHGGDDDSRDDVGSRS